MARPSKTTCASAVRRPMAVFGAVLNNAPFCWARAASWMGLIGRHDKRGVMVYQAGTVAAKHWLVRAAVNGRRQKPPDRMTHFSAELWRSFYRPRQRDL